MNESADPAGDVALRELEFLFEAVEGAGRGLAQRGVQRRGVSDSIGGQDDQHGGQCEALEQQQTGQEHARHGEHDREPGDQHGPPGRRGGDRRRARPTAVAAEPDLARRPEDGHARGRGGGVLPADARPAPPVAPARSMSSAAVG